jgi:molecular chaperone DnaK
MLREHRDKISDADARNIEDAVSEAKKAIEEGGLERIRAAQDRLMQASHKLAEAMYRAAGAQQPSGDGAAGARAESAKKDDVVDAEFVDVDDQKK